MEDNEKEALKEHNAKLNITAKVLRKEQEHLC